MLGGDLGAQRGGTAPRLGKPLAHLLQQRCQREPRVADQAEVDGHVLVQVGCIDRGLDHACLAQVLRPWDAEACLGEACPDAEDDICLGQEGVEFGGVGPAPGLERKRMCLGEGALALDAGRNGGLEQFGELAQLGPRFAVMHALTRIDDGQFGFDEDLRGLAHGSGVRGAQRLDRWAVVEFSGEFLVEQVPRHFDHARTGTSVLGLGERAPDGVRNLLRERDLFDRLGDVLEVHQRAEVGLDIRACPRVACRDHDHRDGLAVGLGHPAEGVLHARTMLHREYAHLAGRAQPPRRVRHVQAGALLAHDHGPDILFRTGLHDGVDRVGDEAIDAFLPQHLGDGARYLHLTPLL